MISDLFRGHGRRHDDEAADDDSDDNDVVAAATTHAVRRHRRRRGSSGAAAAAAAAVRGGHDDDDDDSDEGDSAQQRNEALLRECAAQVQRNLKTHIHTPSVMHTLASYYTRTRPVVYGRPFCVSLSCATFLFHMQMARISVADVELYVQLLICVLAQLRERDSRRDDDDSSNNDDNGDDEDEEAMMTAQLRHPFVQQVLRGYVLGLPTPPPCRHSVHGVVLLPPSQYRAFATLATALLARGAGLVPRAITHQFHTQLHKHCEAAAPLVAHRALALLVQSVPHIDVGEQVRALQYVLRTRPQKVNVDFLLACYARLRRAVPSPAHAPSFARALAIHCSELFLRFHSPVRRAYVEAYLYPALCHPDMRGYLALRATRQHLLRELLAHCAPGMGTSSPYYLCLCALLQPCVNDADEVRAAIELVAMLSCRMPHAAFFVATLAVDVRMSVSMYGKVLLALVRGVGLAMAGRPSVTASRTRPRRSSNDDDDDDDDNSSEDDDNSEDDNGAVTSRDAVAAVMRRDRTSVYNVLYTLREVVRTCATTASRRAVDMLHALRIAIAPTTVEALGKLAHATFDATNDDGEDGTAAAAAAAAAVMAARAHEDVAGGVCGGDGALDAQLMCAELAMVLHHSHLDAAVASALTYFADGATPCAACGLPRSSAPLCAVAGTLHLPQHASMSRVLGTLAECAGSRELHELLIQQLRDPKAQMRGSVHYLVYHICAHAGPHRTTVFVALEPYIRGTLMALVSADRHDSGSTATTSTPSLPAAATSSASMMTRARSVVSSEARASVLMLHVKLAALLSGSLDASYVQTIVHVLGTLSLRNHHDALALWCMGNMLLRTCRSHLLDLLPTDPRDNRYCVDHAACAPDTAVCADNAQLVLRLLDRAHHFSAAMRKLVGPCVCRLMQDYNLQTPNIVHALLSTHGCVPVGLHALGALALPVGAESTFWRFWLAQLRRSAPARTALMAAIARSIALRFRVATPAEAIALSAEEDEDNGSGNNNNNNSTAAAVTGEATAHVFAVCVYEAMKRNAALARVLLYMTSQWLRQAGHTPGKYVCLLYMCTQLTLTIATRGAGVAGVELAAETPHDRDVFVDAAQKAARTLHAQQPRLSKLSPLVRRDNVAFYRLLQRLQYKVRCTTALVSGTPPPPLPAHLSSSGSSVSLDDDNNNNNDDDADDDGVDVRVVDPHVLQRSKNGDSDATMSAYAAYNDNVVFAPVDGVDDAATSTTTTTRPAQRPVMVHDSGNADDDNDDNDAHDVRMTLDELQHADDDGVFDNDDSAGVVDVDEADGSDATVHTTDAAVVDDLTALAALQSTVPTATASTRTAKVTAAADAAADDADTQRTASRRTHGVTAHVQTTSTDVTATSAVRARNDNNDDNGVSGSAAADTAPTHTMTRAAQQQQTQTPPSRAQRDVTRRHHDKAVSVPAERTVATSPITSWTEPSAADEHEDERDNEDKDDDEAVVRVPTRMTWHEPDMSTLLMHSEASDDGTAIADVDVPQLQAAHAHTATTALPSVLVLEYLRTHQGTDSLQHEMQQLNERWVQQQLLTHAASTAAAATPQYALQTVTVEGRVNNYSRPHTDDTDRVPSSTLQQLVRLEHVRPAVPPATTTATTHAAAVATGAAAAATTAAPPPPPSLPLPRLRSTAIVDGEQALEPVSEAAVVMVASHETVVAGKRPRDDEHSNNDDMQRARHAPAAAAQPVVLPTTTTLQRGARYFLQHNRHAAEALHEVQANTAAVTAGVACDDKGGAEAMTAARGTVVAAVSNSTHGLAENLPPTTPYGQMMLPSCFVEQTNDTALRELQQLMAAGATGDGDGHHNNGTTTAAAARTTTSMLMAGGGGGSDVVRRGRRPRHSGTSGRRGGDAEASGDRSATRTSAAWWAEMSTAPMPGYAADPQYSMELF